MNFKRNQNNNFINDQDPDAICFTHNKEVVHFCLHPMCHKLKPLCKQCYKDHQKYHENTKMKGEPEPRNIFKSMKEVQTEVRQTLNEIKNQLDQLENQAFQEVHLELDPETNIAFIIKELEDIKTNINNEMDEFIKKLKESFERPIRNKILKVWEEIKFKKENILAMQADSESIETIKKTMLSDLQFQTQIQKSRLDDLIQERSQVKFYGAIDDDVALRFQGTFKRELDNLIIYPQEINEEEEINRLQKIKYQPQTIECPNSQEPKKFYYTNPYDNAVQLNTGFGNINNSVSQGVALPQQSNPNQTIIPGGQNRNINWYQNMQNYMYFFEAGTKVLHLYDLENQKYKKVYVNMDFNFYQDHQSVIGPDGNVYILGGYDSEINEDNEDIYKHIYRLEYTISDEAKIVKTDIKLETVRKHFSMCVLGNQIYIIGGFNYRQGNLRKCEKIIFEQKPFERQTSNQSKSQYANNHRLGGGTQPQEVQFDIRMAPINLLKYKCSHSTAAAFRNKYIFKLGGIDYDLKYMDENKKRKLSNYIEIYSVEIDKWDAVDISYELSIQNFFSGSAIQVNPHYIFVFGGKDEKGKCMKQSYMLKVIEETSDGLNEQSERNLNLELDLSCTSLPFPAYTGQNCLIHNNIVYARLLNKTDEIQKVSPSQNQLNIEIGQHGIIYGFKNNSWKPIQMQEIL